MVHLEPSGRTAHASSTTRCFIPCLPSVLCRPGGRQVGVGALALQHIDRGACDRVQNVLPSVRRTQNSVGP